MRQASERWKLVDCGSTTASSAIRTRKKICSARRRDQHAAEPSAGRAFIAASASGAQLGQHLRRRRAHAAPDQEGLGRLLHQHAQAVARHGAMRARPVQEACGGGAVHHVAGQGAGLQHAGRHRNRCAAHAGGGGVDHHVECAADRRSSRRFERHVVLRGQRRMPMHQRGLGPACGWPPRCGAARPRQRPQHAGRGAARAQQQHVAAGKRDAGVARDVVDQADAVGVVGKDFVAVEAQHVAGLASCGARRQLRGQRRRLELEGHGDVAALAALGPEGAARRRRSRRAGSAACRIAGRWPVSCGEARVDPRRLAVFHRVAHDAVKVGRHRSQAWLVELVSSVSSRR